MWLNKNVFNLDLLKTLRDGALRTVAGSAFQTVEAALVSQVDCSLREQSVSVETMIVVYAHSHSS